MMTPCFVLLRVPIGTFSVEAVRVFLDRDAADAAKKLAEWDRDAAVFAVKESVVELPETT